MRCEWCGITVNIKYSYNKKKIIFSFFFLQTHSTCRSRVPEECGFGTLRDIIIPPYAISIPRIADLNKDLILGIGKNTSKSIQNTSNNYSILPPQENAPPNAGSLSE
jgi:diacylglycerol kinase (ATP)